MLRRIKDLDFREIVARVERATAASKRQSCDDLLQADLGFVQTPSDAVALLSNNLVLAALRHTKTLDDIDIKDPLVQAVVRTQHHPLAPPIPSVHVEEGLRGPDAGQRLRDLVAAHPELSWDVDIVQDLVIRAIRQFGDHELDDSQPPWLMYWSPASAAASALIVLVTLRVFGDLAR